jgi:hypothetical protein
LIAISNFRTGKNRTTAKINEVNPYQSVSMIFQKKGPRASGFAPVAAESLTGYWVNV